MNFEVSSIGTRVEVSWGLCPRWRWNAQLPFEEQVMDLEITLWSGVDSN